jgi:hypothetical protein
VPHLTLPITPTGGPLLDFVCGVSRPRAEALKKAGLPVPPNINVKGLVDTGASITSIDPSILKALSVISTGTIPLHTPSTKAGVPHVANQFDVSLILVHPKAIRTWFALPVIEAELIHQGIQALIGRDVLKCCLLTYDGEAGTFAIGF